jgi:hypothetical protein
MKKAIGLGLLMLTGMTAFAAPAAAVERFYRAPARKEVVVVHHNRRARFHRVMRERFDRYRR